MTVTAPSRLHRTLTLGAGHTVHRIGLAPLTRYRNAPETQAPTSLAVDYYTQRSSRGGLLITEATFINKLAGGYPLAPILPGNEKEWKAVTDGAHSKGSVIFVQLWALGRANAGAQPDVPTVGASPIGLADHPVPRELTEADLEQYLGWYKQAAESALAAGFDGVELHGANGYLIDQFLQEVSNKRTDQYGGSVENRARFPLKVLETLIGVLGEERVGVRTSAWGRFQEMLDPNPYPQFLYFLNEIKRRWPKFAYVHVTEARNWTGAPITTHVDEGIIESNDAFRAIFREVSYEGTPSEFAQKEVTFPDPTPELPTLILSAAGHTADNVEAFVERSGDVAVIGRYFIANPDLPSRIFNKHPINHYDRDTFYSAGAHGYTDLPTWEEEQAAKVAA